MWWNYYGTETLISAVLILLLVIGVFFVKRMKEKTIMYLLAFILFSIGDVITLIAVIYIRGWGGIAYASIGLFMIFLGTISFLCTYLYLKFIEPKY